MMPPHYPANLHPLRRRAEPRYHPHKGELVCDDCAEFMRLMISFTGPANDEPDPRGYTAYDKARDEWGGQDQ